jgi:hypothetical protein
LNYYIIIDYFLTTIPGRSESLNNEAQSSRG